MDIGGLNLSIQKQVHKTKIRPQGRCSAALRNNLHESCGIDYRHAAQMCYGVLRKIAVMSGVDGPMMATARGVLNRLMISSNVELISMVAVMMATSQDFKTSFFSV
jgi:hypothetical protein